MNRDLIESMLVERGIRPTPNRILILAELMKANHPLNLADIELALDPMDKASIFRVLGLLAEKDIVHEIVDGTRSVKYEFCHGQGHHSVNDQHVHFYCENCRETFCLEDKIVPVIDLPDGFKARQVNYVIKGICPKCSAMPD